MLRSITTQIAILAPKLMGMCVIEEISRSSSTLLSELCTTIQEKEAKEVEEVEDEVEGVVVGPLPNLLVQLLTYFFHYSFLSFLLMRWMEVTAQLESQRPCSRLSTRRHAASAAMSLCGGATIYIAAWRKSELQHNALQCAAATYLAPSQRTVAALLSLRTWSNVCPAATTQYRRHTGRQAFHKCICTKKKYNISECSPHLIC